jgi:hypothetical protein
MVLLNPELTNYSEAKDCIDLIIRPLVISEKWSSGYVDKS